jgi:hypothetical protein
MVVMGCLLVGYRTVYFDKGKIDQSVKASRGRNTRLISNTRKSCRNN